MAGFAKGTAALMIHKVATKKSATDNMNIGCTWVGLGLGLGGVGRVEVGLGLGGGVGRMEVGEGLGVGVGRVWVGEGCLVVNVLYMEGASVA